MLQRRTALIADEPFANVHCSHRQLSTDNSKVKICKLGKQNQVIWRPHTNTRKPVQK